MIRIYAGKIQKSGNAIAGAEPCCCSECPYFVYLCLNGEQKTLSIQNLGFYDFTSWGWLTHECCDDCVHDVPPNTFTFWYLSVEIFFTPPGTISFEWELWCIRPHGTSTIIDSGLEDWSPMCTDPEWSATIQLGDIACDAVLRANLTPTPCDIICGSTPPIDCCDFVRWVCVNGDSREMDLDGGDETWDVTECCPDCPSATLRNRLTCNDGVVSLEQTYTCDGIISFQNTTLSPGICDVTAPVTVNFSTAQCFLRTTITLNEQECDSCDSCCDETRWYCINNQSKQMTLAGDSDTFDVADCCDCTTATLTLDVECIGLTNTLRYDWSLVCDGGAAITGFDFLACDASVLNIEAGDCFLQVAITTTDIGCAECGGETTTIISPP